MSRRSGPNPSRLRIRKRSTLTENELKDFCRRNGIASLVHTSAINGEGVASDRHVIVNPGELRKRLEATDPDWRFTDDEMLTAVGHLENYGYVKHLRTVRQVCRRPYRGSGMYYPIVPQAGAWGYMPRPLRGR